ncbi:hypothetical protein PMIN03_007425 [Paraphaeosphaeria minitans]
MLVLGKEWDVGAGCATPSTQTSHLLRMPSTLRHVPIQQPPCIYTYAPTQHSTRYLVQWTGPASAPLPLTVAGCVTTKYRDTKPTYHSDESIAAQRTKPDPSTKPSHI